GYYNESDYRYFNPPLKASKESWAYWNDYYATMPDDYGSRYPPRSSFQEALNRSWQLGEVIQPAEKPDDPSIYFHDGKLELLTPIIIDGETQAIILSVLQTSEMDESIANEWQSYRNMTIPTVVILIILFFWYEHRTLAKIPKGMNLQQWEKGMWRPSLITLYLVDGFRYYHLFNMLCFLIFSVVLFFMPAQELWHEELTWDMWLIHIAAIMSLPLLFGLFVIPRMVTDYRLFAKGIPVPCKKVGSKTEEMTMGYVRHGSIRTNTEYHDRHLYEANYKGKLYKFSAPAGKKRGNPAIALINPRREDHGILLNAFCEGY
ncbi:hypothetical protein KA005_09290, partial [bacterium]|nr:hypothetical protein [bacterium]